MMRIIISCFSIFILNSFGLSAQIVKDCKIAGVNIVSPKNSTSEDYLAPVQRISINWIALVPYAFMTTGNPEIRYNTSENWWGGKPEGLRNSSKLASKNKLKTLLKPHFWLDNERWAGEISFNEKGWDRWEENYKVFILTMARIAESQGFEMFCIGTEMKSSVQERPEYWTKLIPEIKKVYRGKLVYAANWDNFKNIHFWAEIDYIGVDAYFPLSEQDTPSVGELMFAWEKPKMDLKTLADSLQKKILFTEMGYRSIDKCAWKQWEIESIPSDQKINLKAQENGYNAIFKCFWDQEWFAGGFIWKWQSPDDLAGGKNKSNYSPQNKPVEKLIKKCFEEKCIVP